MGIFLGVWFSYVEGGGPIGFSGFFWGVSTKTTGIYISEEKEVIVFINMLVI